MPRKTDGNVVSDNLQELKDETYVSTGIQELDEMVGGWAVGRMTQVWGKPGVGKSFLLAKTMAALPKDANCLYVDAEYSLVKERLKNLGVNLAQVTVVQDGRFERVTEHIVSVVGQFDLIIIDSLPKLIPMVVDDNEVGVNAIGLFARNVKHFEAKLKPRLARSKTAFIVINQARAGMGVMSPAKPQGGYAWEHGIDMQLKLEKGANNKIYKQVAGEKTQIGHLVTATVEKSRLTPPYISTKFQLLY